MTRHKVLVSVLDGYPSLPPVEELCRDHEELTKASGLKKETPGEVVLPATDQNSVHSPYEEKRCNDCHRENKGEGGGGDEEGLLVKPREELCFICHKNIIAKPFQHGPAAVGDCLACHLPHDSKYPALLSVSKDALCKKCHMERRKAARMHEQFVEKDMACVSCHDPHAGNTSYFLK